MGGARLPGRNGSNRVLKLNISNPFGMNWRLGASQVIASLPEYSVGKTFEGWLNWSAAGHHHADHWHGVLSQGQLLEEVVRLASSNCSIVKICLPILLPKGPSTANLIPNPKQPEALANRRRFVGEKWAQHNCQTASLHPKKPIQHLPLIVMGRLSRDPFAGKRRSIVSTFCSAKPASQQCPQLSGTRDEKLDSSQARSKLSGLQTAHNLLTLTLRC